MVFGIILIRMMIYRPQGIIPARRRRLVGFEGNPGAGEEGRR
jgi:hypothetical protein